MELTTGAILRRITGTPLSVSAHKLATIILDGIAWKDGYNGLERGTAAFTLGHLAQKTGVSRQHLSLLLAELAASALGLLRWKPNGKFAPWLFRFGPVDSPAPEPDGMSATDDTSLFRDSKNKMIFAGKIEIGGASDVHHTPWAEVIKAAKGALPCWNVDTQAIWQAFRAFNRAKGKDHVPAGYLLGFMRKWRSAAPPAARPEPVRTLGAKEQEAAALTRLAPVQNWRFHERDLQRRIGRRAYDDRVSAMQIRLGLNRFAAALSVHGEAVKNGEISR
ncbi:hypothetical protein [Cypionkella sp.]|uniref:hypothetical protein n=1 Tax=Cypionkella sp. TaxID=2811411 RepID=UPI00271B5D97|nr:hypothetical protein [Cypionkella sp.]MDO8986377.1 hypothetical protein [Cypionkella sp.]MDP1576042.1 hypothetical protein [Cypionkella sp.]MDP2050018.1 hypothetical protein [Cypionkella sp.]